MSSRRPVRLLVLALLTFLCGGCANSVSDFIIERPLGALSEMSVRSQFRMDRDPLVHGFVDRIGQTHRASVGRKDVPYRFSVVEEASPNAFAIPWGGIYVTKGLLKVADSEDQVGFVMGHEVGHVERRHSSFAFQRNTLIMVGLAMLTNEKNASYMDLVYLGNYLLDLSFSRQNETSADTEGALFSVRSKYDPHAGPPFFQKLDELYGATPRFWGYFQTHPINRDRINHINSLPYLSPSDPALLTGIGDGYRERHQYHAAERYYQQAIKADPQYGGAYAGLARVAAWRGDGETARRLYDEARTKGAADGQLEAQVGSVSTQAPPPVYLVPPAAPELEHARGGLDQLGTATSTALAAATPLTTDPLDAAPALVAGNALAGRQIDALSRLGEKLPGYTRELVTGGQQLRSAALSAATETTGAQDEAKETLDQLADNRARLAAKLAGRPSAATVALIQRISARDAALAEDLQHVAQRLHEARPGVTRAVKQSQAAIGTLYDELGGYAQGQRRLSPHLDDQLKLAAEATNQARARVAECSRKIQAGHARALVSSIDITLLDRPVYDREEAQGLTEHLMLAERGQLRPLLDDRLGYGESAFVLGFAKSSQQTPASVVKEVGEHGRLSLVERLDSGREAHSGDIEIILRLLDRTLRAELDPPKPKTKPKPTPPPPPAGEQPVKVS